ncbi:hypothetical protein AGMMS49959_19150 [Planctomycetales bacterium]|nr:hypothetical protein AGMMS49959_19150 [Planctomycetales bacterium]
MKSRKNYKHEKRESEDYRIYKRKRGKNGKSVEDANYQMAFRDHKGISHNLALCATKRASVDWANNITDIVNLRRGNRVPNKNALYFIERCDRRILDRLVEWDVLDATYVTADKTTLEVFKNDYVAKLKAKGRSQGHRNKVNSNLTKVFDQCRWSVVADLDATIFDKWWQKYSDDNNLVPSSRNRYSGDVRAFGEYLRQRIPELPMNPLLYVGKVERIADADRVYLRRAAAEWELTALRIAAENYNGRIQGFDGETSAYLLRAGVTTALRTLEELLPLTWGDFDPERMTMRARRTKNGKAAWQPLPPTLVADLVRWGKGKKRTDKIFVPLRRERDKNKKHWFRGADFMRNLCELAGVEYETADGVLDFYATTRHTGITRYILAGHTMAETIKFACHSDSRVTIDHYEHLENNETERRLRGTSLAEYGLDIRPNVVVADNSDEPASTAASCDKKLDCEMDCNWADLDGFMASDIDELASADNVPPDKEKPLFSRSFLEKTRAHKMEPSVGLEPTTCALRKHCSTN